MNHAIIEDEDPTGYSLPVPPSAGRFLRRMDGRRKHHYLLILYSSWRLNCRRLVAFSQCYILQAADLYLGHWKSLCNKKCEEGIFILARKLIRKE